VVDAELAVIIPTTHWVERVTALVHRIRDTSPVTTTVVIVDNGPKAERDPWAGVADRLIVDKRWLGTEQAFATGLRSEPTASRFLLLDHDARLEPTTIERLLEAGGDDENACCSGNHNGSGECWSYLPGVPVPGFGEQDVTSVDFAPWSGLLLSAEGAKVVINHDSGYFFGWDDYLASWRIRSAGLQLLGVRTAVVWNDGTTMRAPWRLYYGTRNQLLLHRQTRAGSLSKITLLRLKQLLDLAIRRDPSALAVLRGIGDAVIGRRGMRVAPAGIGVEPPEG
jgi:GT2 family glycosyltransferase